MKRRKPLIGRIIDEVREEANEPPSIPIVHAVLSSLVINSMEPDGSYNVPHALIVKELMLRGWSEKAAEEGIEMCVGLRGPFAGTQNH